MSATTSGDLAAISDGQIPNSPEIVDPNVRASIDTANRLMLDAMTELPDDDGSAIEAEPETDEDGQPRNPDGTFAAKAEPDATGDETDPDAPVAEEVPAAPETTVVTLLDRNGNERPIEISDPEIAEILLANKNEGLRKQELKRQTESIEKERAEYREFKALIRTPEQLAEQLDPEVQVRMATYLIAQHWDRVLPTLNDWAVNDLTRQKFQIDAEREKDTQSRQIKTEIAEGNRRQGIGTAIESLIPETASPEDAQDFFTAAAAHIAAVDAQRGYTLRPEDVAPLVDRFRARFGFTSPTPPVAATPPSLVPVLKAAVATPVAGKAAEIQKRATATAQRMKALPAQQATAAKVARSSAGVQPAQPPRPKDIDEANANFLSILRGAYPIYP